MASIKELQNEEMAVRNRLLVKSKIYQKSVVKTERDMIYLDCLRDQHNAMRTRLLELMEIDVEALVAERDALLEAVRDAKRYRWLRDPDSDVALVIDKVVGYEPVTEFGTGGYHCYEYRAGEDLDAAIDAAMAASEVQP